MLTPADVHNVSFRRTSLGRRGYDEKEVDLLLEMVEDQLLLHVEESKRFRDEREGFVHREEACAQWEITLERCEQKYRKWEESLNQREQELARKYLALQKLGDDNHGAGNVDGELSRRQNGHIVRSNGGSGMSRADDSCGLQPGVNAHMFTEVVVEARRTNISRGGDSGSVRSAAEARQIDQLKHENSVLKSALAILAKDLPKYQNQARGRSNRKTTNGTAA
ncbi:DivIVA domain-containing protein [Mycobacterium sp.]|uniref:DivIVA domain-containing protein n=1 Tax=Mycobacterium sp. TaxID=1785 RepID=UPI003BA9DF65